MYTVLPEPSGAVPRTSSISEAASNTTFVTAPGIGIVSVTTGPSLAAVPDTAMIESWGSLAVVWLDTYSCVPSSTPLTSARPCAPPAIATLATTDPVSPRIVTPSVPATASSGTGWTVTPASVPSLTAVSSFVRASVSGGGAMTTWAWSVADSRAS